ncbi:hypothetical protein GFER_04395 [Geoalkalibacter ferrihydriticus DSM 17813]|uniref:Outer membrane protein beta-barrel domain-containing protein n=2 Tax=Geoalkalibacter ferrihydriticus TaxID=392333 RepID=A0A0C2HTW1_9BACT|nr:hypothetical protein GFER_04395 [Geoalkalibacter ferrihydriticus DSM 17813]
MRFAYSTLALSLVLLLAAIPATADELISVKGGYLVLSPSGQFAGNTGGTGTRIDMEKDLNLDDSKNITLEAALQLGNFRLSAGYMPLRFSGDGVLQRDIVFNNTLFEENVQARSDVDIDFYDVGLTWYLINFDNLPVRIQLGPEIAVKVVDADLSLTSPQAGQSERVSVTAPLPTIGARARIALADFLGVAARIGYIEYADNSFLDADVQVEFSPVPFFGAFAGYRHFELQIDENDVYLDTQLVGPYAGLFLRF